MSMTKLKNKNTNSILVPELRIAESFWTRMKGLLGSQTLPEQQALWIPKCNSIHTYFMKYAIDCVFVDANLKIVSIKENIKPGSLVWPQRYADSVFELPAGKTSSLKLSLGDELYVGD